MRWCSAASNCGTSIITLNYKLKIVGHNVLVTVAIFFSIDTLVRNNKTANNKAIVVLLSTGGDKCNCRKVSLSAGNRDVLRFFKARSVFGAGGR